MHNKEISFIIIVAALLTSTAIFNNIGNAQQEEKKQVYISSDNIKKVDSIGDYKGEKHVKFYTPNKLVDNLTNSISFWSQNGDSSFSIELKKAIPDPICSLEIGVKEPQLKTPFTIKLSNSSGYKQAAGVLDQANKKATIEKCLNNVDKIGMSFKPTSQVIEDRWTILSEIKLFTDTNIDVPPVEPPICKPNEHVEGDKCVPNPPEPPVEPPIGVNGSITNSNVTLMVSNSTVTIIADETSSIVTPTVIPENVATSDPNDKSDEKEEEQEEQEQQEEEEEDNDSKKDKKGDDN